MISPLLLLASWITPTLQFTHYVDENTTTIVSSVSPCHIYGDADSYGIGVRASLYLQFFAALIVQAAELDEEVKSIRLGFNIVATATMINTYIGTSSGSFAYLEWYLVSALVLTLPLIVITPFGSVAYNYFKQLKAEGNRASSTHEEGTTPTNLENSDQIVDGEIRKRDSSDPLATTKESIKPWLEDPFALGWSMLLLCFFLGTQIWLYFFGLHQGHRSECTVKVFLYANVNMYNSHWIGFLKAMSILAMISVPVILIVSLGLMGFGLYKSTKKEDSYSSKDESIQVDIPMPPENQPQQALSPSSPSVGESSRKEPSPNIDNVSGTVGSSAKDIGEEIRKKSSAVKSKRHQRWTQRFFIVFQAFLGIGFQILWIERTIVLNKIDLSASPWYSSGQLSAIVVGIFTAIPAIWKSFWKLYRERKTDREELASIVRDAMAKFHERRIQQQKEKERIERERQEETRRRQAAADSGQQPLIIIDEPSSWKKTFAVVGNRLPSWRGSAVENRASKAEQGLGESGGRGKGKEPE